MKANLVAEIGPQLLQNAAAKHFGYFQRIMHPVVSSETYVHAAHTRAIAEALEKVARGLVRRLIINVPPRHFKSYQSSVAFPAYLLGLDPSLRIICASYGSDLSDPFGRQSRDIMQSPLYQAIFPATRLRSKTPPVGDLVTTKNGYRFATSVGGVLTGKGADIAIIDDPMKAGDQSSDTIRDGIGEWFKTSLMTRFDKPAESRVVVVMQRLHMDDLAGRLKAEGGWEIIDLPAIAQTAYSIDLGLGQTKSFLPGDILFPERITPDVLEQMRFDLGEAGYAAQMLQRPTPAGGHLFDLGKARRFTLPAALNMKIFEATIVSVDCASAGTLSSDYTAITTWGVKGPLLYLIHAARGQWTLPKTLTMIRPIIAAAASKNRGIVVETGGAGLPLIQQLREEGVQQVWPFSPKNNKDARAEFANLKLEQQRVRLPHDAPWLEQVEAELAAYPHGKNDDYVDSISQVTWCLEINLGHFLHLSSYPSPKG